MGRLLRYAALTIALLLAGCGGDDDSAADEAESEPSVTTADLAVLADPFDDVEQMMEDAGLEVCRTDEGSGDISGSYDSLTISVAAESCDSDQSYPAVHLYNEEGTAASELTASTTDAYIRWLVDPTTLVIVGESSQPDVLEALRSAFSDYPVGGPGAEG